MSQPSFSPSEQPSRIPSKDYRTPDDHQDYQQLQEANLKLQEELESLAYAISHDLRAPLRHITQFMGILMDYLDTSSSKDSKLQGYCRNIENATEDLQHRQKAILAYSRLGRQSLRWERLEVAELMGNILQVHQEELMYANAEVELVTCNGSIFSDEYMFSELFAGLLKNAIKFSQDSNPPKIVISFRTTPNHFLFQVQDNGIGFSAERERNLFQLFQHIHSASETNFRGLGCGLAFCRRICDRLGGTIWGKGKPGKGASFFVQLPIQIHPPSELFPENLRFKRY